MKPESYSSPSGDWHGLGTWDPDDGDHHVQFHWDWEISDDGQESDNRVRYSMWTLCEDTIEVARPLPTWWILTF